MCRQECTCLHVQVMRTVDLWDYLLLRIEGEVLGGLQCRGAWSGGSCGVVSWHDDMRNKMTSTKCSYPSCMYMYICIYMYIHAHGCTCRMN